MTYVKLEETSGKSMQQIGEHDYTIPVASWM
jgi:hypothetical protein